jgi:hypothetical protein
MRTSPSMKENLNPSSSKAEIERRFFFKLGTYNTSFKLGTGSHTALEHKYNKRNKNFSNKGFVLTRECYAKVNNSNFNFATAKTS